MRRRRLLSHLRAYGCVFVREGRRHSVWANPANNTQTVVPPTYRDTRNHGREDMPRPEYSQTVGYFIWNGRSGLSSEMAIRQGKAFDGGAYAWYRLQTAYDFAQAMKRADQMEVKRATPVA